MTPIHKTSQISVTDGQIDCVYICVCRAGNSRKERSNKHQKPQEAPASESHDAARMLCFAVLCAVFVNAWVRACSSHDDTYALVRGVVWCGVAAAAHGTRRSFFLVF